MVLNMIKRARGKFRVGGEDSRRTTDFTDFTDRPSLGGGRPRTRLAGLTRSISIDCVRTACEARGIPNPPRHKPATEFMARFGTTLPEVYP